MMTKNADKKREQMLMFCMDDMMPQNHSKRYNARPCPK